ncbi:MAG: hypothetical protein LBK67_10050 [Coriobacteriales bacterium]|jgi:hypothetical protein|nr:hypothetical protein [Coriobacteriales bacterium]
MDSQTTAPLSHFDNGTLQNPDGSLNVAACMAVVDEADRYFTLEREIKNDGSGDVIISDGAGGFRRLALSLA